MSFDVKSLFTNIPVDFTIKLVLNPLFSDEQSKINGLSKKQFDKLLKWTCKKTTLQFNQNCYHQLNGLAMGSTLAPAMADICMNRLTNEVLAKIKNPPVIMRYVDDLFLAFDNPNDIEYVYQIFNSIHPKLKFTKEEENEGKLPFWDVLITKTSYGIETTVYKKPTFSGLYTKWASYTPTKYKRNLINNLLRRAHQICSSFTLLHKEINQISSFGKKWLPQKLSKQAH